MLHCNVSLKRPGREKLLSSITLQTGKPNKQIMHINVIIQVLLLHLIVAAVLELHCVVGATWWHYVITQFT